MTNDVTLDFNDADREIVPQHYAFLVDERRFDDILARIRQRALPYWADPFHCRAGEINTDGEGRGVYFEDPSGHNLEVITRRQRPLTAGAVSGVEGSPNHVHG
jgi:extradiol dioxygenase family protein